MSEFKFAAGLVAASLEAMNRMGTDDDMPPFAEDVLSRLNKSVKCMLCAGNTLHEQGFKEVAALYLNIATTMLSDPEYTLKFCEASNELMMKSAKGGEIQHGVIGNMMDKLLAKLTQKDEKE